jgi:adenylate kinase family enzyme
MFFTGVVGGSGKSTNAGNVSKMYGHKLIALDKCKFGPGWARNSPETYLTMVDSEIDKAIDGKFVIDGTYYDHKLPQQIPHNDMLMDSCDAIVWNHIPRWVAYWRKLLRSFKRYLELEKGAHKETLENVYYNQLNTWNRYPKRYEVLNDKWKKDGTNQKKWIRLNWPHFCRVE